MFPLWPGRLLGVLLCSNTFIIGKGIIRILDCLDILGGGRKWGERGSELGGRVLNKGSGLDVGTPRCSSWVGTQAAVCLPQDDVMAASWGKQTFPVFSGFPARRFRYPVQTHYYPEDDVIGGVRSASQSASPSFVPCGAAEKVSSLGKDWHKLCLKCDRCNKLLNAGGHAEVSHTPPHTLHTLHLKGWFTQKGQ